MREDNKIHKRPNKTIDFIHLSLESKINYRLINVEKSHGEGVLITQELKKNLFPPPF